MSLRMLASCLYNCVCEREHEPSTQALPDLARHGQSIRHRHLPRRVRGRRRLRKRPAGHASPIGVARRRRVAGTRRHRPAGRRDGAKHTDDSLVGIVLEQFSDAAIDGFGHACDAILPCLTNGEFAACP